jgi:D-sedoheptulose 7-phosphate isomerase
MIKKISKKNINKMASSSKSLEHFSKLYVDYLNNLLTSIDFRKLTKLSKILLNARVNKKTIFVIGNGGSAATASSMANDLGFDIIKKTRTNKPFKFLSLTDNSPVLTAISNDTGYENIFLNQLKIHYKKGDIAIMISASGNSKNLLLAAKWIKKKGGTIFSLLGFDGGKLKKLSNDYLLIKSVKGDYGPVEDSHLIINHILAHWFQKIFKSKK